MIENIEFLIPNGNRLDLPKDKQFSNYTAVKKAMLNAGGKYNKNGFVFADQGSDVLSRFMNGDKMNLKQEFQFFETPGHLARRMIKLADIQEGMLVLEPEAGRAKIARELPELTHLHCVEIEPSNQNWLADHGYDLVHDDFLTFNPPGKYDRIIANPPFSKGQDIAHIMQMISLCAPGGRIVTISSMGWLFKNDKRHTAFRELMNSMNADFEELSEGTFKGAGTNVRTVLLVINIPE